MPLTVTGGSPEIVNDVAIATRAPHYGENRRIIPLSLNDEPLPRLP